MNLLKLFVMASALLVANAALADVSVIVNSANTQALDKNTIKRMYLNKIKTFADGQEVVAVSLTSDSQTTIDFNKSVLGKSPSQIKSYWAKLVFTGAGAPPTEYKTDKEVIDFIKANPSAIGFIDKATPAMGVKVVDSF